jgi:hypothetical protein
MYPSELGRREKMLSLWVQGRLGERDTVGWGISTLKQARGLSRPSTLALFEFLDSSAKNTESAATAKIWRLFNIAAKEAPDSRTSYEIKNRFDNAALETADIDAWVSQLTPRLSAEYPRRWSSEQDIDESNPDKWVHWSLTTKGEIGHNDLTLSTKFEALRLSESELVRFIDRGTVALSDTLGLAKEIGIITDSYDLTNSSVHRVFPLDFGGSDTPTSDEEDDPDRYDETFAPLVRTLGSVLSALTVKNPDRAAVAIYSWQEKPYELFKRLYAFAGWDQRLVTAPRIADFLHNLSEAQFWRWMNFPEIATVRVTRWPDLTQSDRDKLLNRITAGPSATMFSSDADPSIIDYHRVHELARLADNAIRLPADMLASVQSYKEKEASFPTVIPKVELGLPGPTFSYVTEGNASNFDSVPLQDLLKRLNDDLGTERFARGSDAEAFARTWKGKQKILDAIEQTKSLDSSVFQQIFPMLLSYPHDEPDVGIDARRMAERTASMALALPSDVLSKMADRLCYWLDATDEKIVNFDGADSLWRRLLPFAAEIANRGESEENEDTDLTSAALNEPIGHLLSLFLRRCPSIRPNEIVSGPIEFLAPLKGLTGRAGELVANRICILMSYFYRLDSQWTEQIVLEPMRTDDNSSRRLWEAFSKYARIPQPEVWRQLESQVFKHLTLSLLSPDAKRRLAEMSLQVWVWTVRNEAPFALKVENLRLALELANDGVRAAVAWQYSQMFRSATPASAAEGGPPRTHDLWREIGKPFFKQVWPLEPILQSATSAKGFANVPAKVGADQFSDATNTVLPYLVPFELWSVKTGLGLDIQTSETNEIVRRFPDEILTLMTAVLGERQSHFIHGLKNLLDRLIELHPDFQSDLRLRALRKFAADQV